MRDATTNPFEPGSDLVPQVWAGRLDYMHDWVDVVRARRMKGLYERGRTILGEPGVGKSALVERIRSHARESGDWVTDQLRIPLGSDPMKKVAKALLKLADDAGLGVGRDERIAKLLERVESVSVSGVSLSVREGDGVEGYTALTDLLVEIGTAALARDRMVMVHLDEVQNITDDAALSQILTALGDALKHKVEVEAPGRASVEVVLPLSVYLTGLPEFADLAGARTGATFARRFKPTILRTVDDSDMDEALQEFVLDGWEVVGDDGVDLVHMTKGAARAIVQLSCGEPFLFQLAGQAAWNAGSGDTITAGQVRTGWRGVEDEARSHAERMLRRLSPKEREFVRVMANLEPGERTLTNIATGMGYTSASKVGTFSKRLEDSRDVIARGGRSVCTFRHRVIESYLASSWPYIDQDD